MPEENVGPQLDKPKDRIDPDRGVRFTRHPDGRYIYMYTDDPGVFLTYDLKPVSEKRAQEAGFDMKKVGKDRLRKELLKEAAAEVEAKIAEIETRVEEKVEELEGTEKRDAVLRAHAAATGPTKKVPREDGWVERQPPKEEEDFQIKAAKMYGNMGICNSKGQLRETPELIMNHIGRGIYNVVDKRKNEIVEGGAKVTGEEGVQILLAGPEDLATDPAGDPGDDQGGDDVVID